MHILVLTYTHTFASVYVFQLVLTYEFRLLLQSFQLSALPQRQCAADIYEKKNLLYSSSSSSSSSRSTAIAAHLDKTGRKFIANKICLRADQSGVCV